MPPIAYPLLPALPSTTAKAPGDVLDYLFDFTQEFSIGGGSPGDSLSVIDGLSASPSGSLQIASGNIVSGGMAILFWAASGIADLTYTISVTAQTASGRTYVREGLIPVANV